MKELLEYVEKQLVDIKERLKDTPPSFKRSALAGQYAAYNDMRDKLNAALSVPR